MCFVRPCEAVFITRIVYVRQFPYLHGVLYLYLETYNCTFCAIALLVLTHFYRSGYPDCSVKV